MPNKALKDKLNALINSLDDSKLLQEVYTALSTNNATHLLDTCSSQQQAKKRHEAGAGKPVRHSNPQNESPERFVLY
jgi:hypothetical protein